MTSRNRQPNPVGTLPVSTVFVSRIVQAAIQAWSLLVHCHSGCGLIAKCIENGTTLMMAQSNRAPSAMEEHFTFCMTCSLSVFYAYNVSNACFGGKMVWHHCCLWIYLDCNTVLYFGVPLKFAIWISSNLDRNTFCYPFGGCKWFKPFRLEAGSWSFWDCCFNVACSCFIAILGACIWINDAGQTIQAKRCQTHCGKLAFKLLELISPAQCRQQFSQRLYLHRITATVITWVNSWQLRTQLNCEDVDAALWNGIMAIQLLDERYHRLWLSSVLHNLFLQCFTSGLISCDLVIDNGTKPMMQPWAVFRFVVQTMCQYYNCMHICVASSLSLNLPRLQHCNIFLLYRWSVRFQFLNWHAQIAEVQ